MNVCKIRFRLFIKVEEVDLRKRRKKFVNVLLLLKHRSPSPFNPQLSPVIPRPLTPLGPHTLSSTL